MGLEKLMLSLAKSGVKLLKPSVIEGKKTISFVNKKGTQCFYQYDKAGKLSNWLKCSNGSSPRIEGTIQRTTCGNVKHTQITHNAGDMFNYNKNYLNKNITEVYTSNGKQIIMRMQKRKAFDYNEIDMTVFKNVTGIGRRIK